MEQLRTSILDCWNSAKNDEDFINKIEILSQQKGKDLYPILFSLLASMDITATKAQDYWFGTLKHRQELSKVMGKEVSIITALSDFLDSTSNEQYQLQLIDRAEYQRLVDGSIQDKLTGLFNRPYFDYTYKQQASLATRYNTDLSILFLDVDDFKEVNDSMGHITGDYALKNVAEIIMQEKRQSDVAARYGGEEFVLLMPHTSSSNAYILAERIRNRIAQHTFNHQDYSFNLTISGGLAAFPQCTKDFNNLLEMADTALYRAKGAGKNVISYFKDEQRRYLRAKLERPVMVKSLSFHDDEIFTGHSKDICLGGMLFENSTPMPIGSMLKVSIPILNDTPLLLIGRVVRVWERGSSKYDIGLSFSFKEMAKLANTSIAHFLKDNISMKERAIYN